MKITIEINDIPQEEFDRLWSTFNDYSLWSNGFLLKKTDLITLDYEKARRDSAIGLEYILIGATGLYGCDSNNLTNPDHK